MITNPVPDQHSIYPGGQHTLAFYTKSVIPEGYVVVAIVVQVVVVVVTVLVVVVLLLVVVAVVVVMVLEFEYRLSNLLFKHQLLEMFANMFSFQWFTLLVVQYLFLKILTEELYKT